jgi:hypothetical protein
MADNMSVRACGAHVADTCIILEQAGGVWLSGIGVAAQPQHPGFEPQFRRKCWANPAVPAAISKVAAVVCCCCNGWS